MGHLSMHVTFVTSEPPRPATTTTILVADDDPCLRALASIILRRAGLNVLTVADGEEALEGMEHTSPAAVLLDLDMPLVSGRTVLRMVREQPRLSNIPVLVWSSEDPAAAEGEVRELGARDFIPKQGLAPADLVARVMQVLAVAAPTLVSS
jgi:CheY-like chemotaxis protein